MILHRIQVWEGKKIRNKGKQAYFWDFLTIPGTSHFQVVLFSQSWPLCCLTTPWGWRLDTWNSCKVAPKLQSNDLTHHCQCSPSLHLPTAHWAYHNTGHTAHTANTCWWDGSLSPPLWHLTNDRLPSLTSIPVLAPFLFSTALQMQSSTWTTWWGYMTHFSL